MSTSLEPLMNKLLSRSALPLLRPTRPYDDAISQDIKNTNAGPVLQATLHLLNDDIPRAHDLAQAHEESMTANLTHAILHRREGDYWNSKWWLSRISHPLLQDIHQGTKGAKKFVDDCEKAHAGKSQAEVERLQEVQWRELKALVQYAANEESR